MLQKDAQIGELTRKIESLQRQVTTLQQQMEQMLRRLYDRKSEQLKPNQMMFDSIVLESLERASIYYYCDYCMTKKEKVISGDSISPYGVSLILSMRAPRGRSFFSRVSYPRSR